ncbi:MAG: universal stress protein [Meiothermus sp.]|uniref:universal stress protein n=1 Tax=Meiothermus sp. TaxID=1955249 RepID=UPI0025ECC819|nr:universal stress protein [Meiothermus sp.]MCS7058479.1 universal stress protein [Meiothermus sp.]MDW8091668.1 universal stress protein [Meiothermus sp.]MDW8480984.1 universal stress protein [Meiothermus sp.]
MDETTLHQAKGLLHELGVDPVSSSLLQGHPAESLTALTASGTLLVMGTHGRGVFLGLRFGRTVDGVVQGAQGSILICP